MKKNGIARAIEYGNNQSKKLSPKSNFLAGYNQALEDYNSIETEALMNVLTTEIMVLREKNAELTEWKDSASIILNNINLQAIGSELHLKLGSDISSQVLPEIKKIKQCNAELVEMLKKAKSTIATLKRSMLVHPDCEIDSEFDDYTSTAQEVEDEIESLINSNIKE